MTQARRKNPYQRLLDEIVEYCRKVRYPRIRTMWVYPEAKLNNGWPLRDLYERTKAAEQLGYDVILEAEDKGLVVRYRKQVPEVPYRWR